MTHSTSMQAVSAAQHPCGFQEHHLTYENASPRRDLALDQRDCLLELSFVIQNQEADEMVNVASFDIAISFSPYEKYYSKGIDYRQYVGGLLPGRLPSADSPDCLVLAAADPTSLAPPAAKGPLRQNTLLVPIESRLPGGLQGSMIARKKEDPSGTS